ncbi:fibronectin type III domain protein, partial [Opisthorchis viverrini]
MIEDEASGNTQSSRRKALVCFISFLRLSHFFSKKKPTEVTNLVANVQQKLTDAYVIVNISWTSPSNCKIRMFKYSYIANTGEKISGSTSERNAIIHWAEYCAPIDFTVWGETSEGQGDTLQKNITLAKIPNIPVNAQANLNRDKREWSITWEDTSECHFIVTHSYIVNVYDANAQRTLQKNVTRKSVQINELDPCKKFSAGIITVGIAGQSPESRPVVLHVPEGFDPPPDILIKMLHNEARVSVTWGAEKICEDTKYEVTLYDDAGEVLRREKPATSPVRFTQLQKCVPMLLAVRKFGLWWVGDESERKEIQVLENQPSNVRANPIANESQVDVFWDYQSECLYPDFLVSVYNQNGSFVKSVATSAKNGRKMEVHRLPQCVLLTAGVRARNPVGSSSEIKSAEFKIPAVPSPPTDVLVTIVTNLPSPFVSWVHGGACSAKDFRLDVHKTNASLVKTTHSTKKSRGAIANGSTRVPRPPTNIQLRSSANYPNPAILWDYEGACAATHFVVDIYNSDDQLIKSFNVTASPAELLDLPTCALLTAGVSAHNTAGSSSMTKGSEFTIATDFDVPSNIRIVPIHAEKQIMIMWQDTRVCRGTKYDVSLYDEAGAVLQKFQYDKSPGRLTGLRSCVSLFVTMRRTGTQWVGAESDKMKVQILDTPSDPKNIRGQVTSDKSRVEVSWQYDSVCASPEFVVNLYTTEVSAIKSVITNSTQAQFANPPSCVAMSVGVLALPVLPKAVKVAMSAEKATVNVSWTYDGDCAAASFLVEVYNSARSLQTSVQANGLSTEITGLPVCVELFVSVQGQNEFGSGPKTKNSKFTIPAVPQKPANVSVNVQHTKKSIRVSWDDASRCPAEKYDVVVHAQRTPTVYSTSKKTLVLDWLASCVTYTLRVAGVNKHGKSGLSNTVELLIPEDFKAPTNVKVEPKHKQSQISVEWDFGKSCDNMTFEVSLYNRQDRLVKKSQVESSPTLFTKLPKCEGLYVTVRAIGRWWSSPESDRENFKILD